MTDDDLQIFLIEKYFESIERRIAYLDEMVNDQHTDEAFLLCSVYIESLANRFYQDYSNAKGFCCALIELTGNELFSLIHPKQLLNKLEKNKLFNNNLDEIKKILDPLQNKLIPLKIINKSLLKVFNEDQIIWLNEYGFKGSMAMIAYERIRCEAVHDMWVTKLSFGATWVDEKPVPDIDYNLLKVALDKIVSYLKERSLCERNLFLKNNEQC